MTPQEVMIQMLEVVQHEDPWDISDWSAGYVAAIHELADRLGVDLDPYGS